MRRAAGLRSSTNPAVLKSLRAAGARGFLLYRGSEGEIFAIQMHREDGEWKVAGLAGLPLT